MYASIRPIQCIVSGVENPRNCPFSWDFVTAPEEDTASAKCSMHKIAKDRACDSGDILADRHTERHRNTHTHTDVLITITRLVTIQPAKLQ